VTARSHGDNRRLLPRWRPWRLARALGETMPAVPRLYTGPLDDYDAASAEWRAQGGAARASEFISAALVANHADGSALAAATQLMQDASANALQRYVAARVSAIDDRPGAESSAIVAAYDYDAVLQARVRVKELRARLELFPRNALTWTDLAREYLVLAQYAKASRALETARALDGANRFIARSAALYYSTSGDARAADRVLVDGPDAQDPWIMAARVAVGSSLSGRSLRGARRAIDDGEFAPWHVGELTAGIATWELENGNDRAGRKLMRRALVDPTENVLAQVEWARGRGFDSFDRLDWTSRLEPHEARARRLAGECRWVDAARSALLWLADQPFALDAAATASYCAIEAGQLALADSLLTRALQTSPGDALLLNNRAYARACAWDLEGAVGDLASVAMHDVDPQGRGCILATTGLVLFRLGNLEDGRAFYEKSIRLLLERGFVTSAARAAVNLAAEEMRLRVDSAPEASRRAESLVNKSGDPGAADAWRRVLAKVPSDVTESPYDAGPGSAALRLPGGHA